MKIKIIRYNDSRIRLVRVNDLSIDFQGIISKVKDMLLKFIKFALSKLGGLGSKFIELIKRAVSRLRKAESATSTNNAAKESAESLNDIKKADALVKRSDIPAGIQMGLKVPLGAAMSLLIPMIKGLMFAAKAGNNQPKPSLLGALRGRPLAIGYDNTHPLPSQKEEYLTNQARDIERRWTHTGGLETAAAWAIRGLREGYYMTGGPNGRRVDLTENEIRNRKTMLDKTAMAISEDIGKLSEILSKSKEPSARKYIWECLERVKREKKGLDYGIESLHRMKERERERNAAYGKVEPKSGEFNSNKGFSEHGRFSNLDSCYWI